MMMLKKEKERYLQKVWFDTYNAAITGCLANGYDATVSIRRAREVADKTSVFVGEHIEEYKTSEVYDEELEIVF